MSEIPTLATIFDAFRENMMRGLRVCGPAKVLSYDSTTQKCSVQPLIHEGEIDEDGERKTARLPVISSVPVMHLTGGQFQLTMPVTVGDTVLIIYSDRSLDRWLVRGGEVDPADDRTHDITDAIAIPGLHDFAHALSTAPTDRIRLGYGSNDAKIDITTEHIYAGGDVQLAVKADLDRLLTLFTEWVSAATTPAALAAEIKALFVTGWTIRGTNVLRGDQAVTES